MSYVAVLPFVYRPYLEACVETIKFPLENILFVDNTENNLGVMRSHNRGIDMMRECNADWLIIMSAAIRFGPTGGVDFVKLVLDRTSDHYIIHAASENVMGGKQQEGEGGGHNEVFGWHLTAFRKDVFDNVGRWDQNFTPYGLDDIDLSVRVQHHYGVGAPGWNTYPCDVHDTTMAHSINFAGVEAPYEPRRAYFEEKWGRDPAAWQSPEYPFPFNSPDHSLAYWPDAPDGGKWND